MRQWPPVPDTHHHADLTWRINSRDDHYLLSRWHDEMTRLLDGLCEPMHDGQRGLDCALHRRLFHPYPKKPVRQRVPQVAFGASDVPTLLEHLEHPEDLAARTSHSFSDRIDAHRRRCWREELQDVQALIQCGRSVLWGSHLRPAAEKRSARLPQHCPLRPAVAPTYEHDIHICTWSLGDVTLRSTPYGWLEGVPCSPAAQPRLPPPR